MFMDTSLIKKYMEELLAEMRKLNAHIESGGVSIVTAPPASRTRKTFGPPRG